MDKIEIVDSLAALAHPTRLAVLEHLLNCGAAGRSAGDLGRALKIPQSTMSAHLTVLNVARLTSRTRRSRSIIYRVEPATLLHLLSFLIGMSAAHPDVREGLKKVEGVLSQASPQN